MKKIRQGNDFLVTWRIKRAGINEDLTQAVNMSLVASVKSDGLIHSKIVPFDIVDNSIVRIEVTPQIAQWVGIYNFVLKYEFDYPSYADNNEKVAVDKNMFIIVSRTAQADEITIIECESDVLIGLKGEKGDSAFTVWNKENGGNNTYDDWLAFLQSPATEIEGIVSANEAIRIENENTRKLNEIERKQSEETRLQNESARVTAEIDREENEDTRSLNEATRLTNEDDRNANENQRVIDEGKREQLYDNTVILKGEVETLKTETETAKDSAISAATLANDKANLANVAAQNATDATIEAQTATQEATTAASLADTARLAIQDDLALKAEHGYEINPKTLKEVDDEVVQLEDNMGVTFSIVKDPTVKFTAGELATLKAVKDIKIRGIDLSQDWALNIFVGPGGDTTQRIYITNRADENDRHVVYLDNSEDVAWTHYVSGDVKIDVLVDWRGVASGNILNNPTNDRMILSKRCYLEETYITEAQFDSLNDSVDSLNDSVNFINDNVLDIQQTQGIVDTISGLTPQAYGGSILAWGFPIGIRKNITSITMPRINNATRARIRIRTGKDNKGPVIYDEIFEGITSPNFVLSEAVANELGQELWLEVLFDSGVSINRVNPAQIYTEDKGYMYPRWSTKVGAIDLENPIMNKGNSSEYYDIQAFVNCLQETVKIKDEALPKFETGGSATSYIAKNLRISCAGSSVTWGTGFLQDSMLVYLIPLLQKERTPFIGLDKLTLNSSAQQLMSVNDRLFFDKKAIRIQGIDSSIKFEIESDEISIVQGIERTNQNASLIDVFIDDVLYDTFSNFNDEPIGHEVQTFTAVDNQKEFPLGKPFTYNHVLKLNGVVQTITLNKGSSMPSSGWAVARDIIETDGKIIVQHTLFSPSSLAAGDTVEIEYDYGQELRYEKTTIGKDGAGTLESTYGRGYTPFDPANPGSSAFGSGLDFRETDERVIQTYKFEKTAKRQVEIKIKSLDTRATGGDTPYFIFNFATGRILYFQNAGIGGWKSTQFNDPTNSMGNVLRTWREIVKFQPDIVFYESTPNDDWAVGGYKAYTINNGLSLAQLQEIRTLPNKRIAYNSGTADYTYEKWAGKIEAIDEYGLILSSDTLIQSAPEVGDSIIVGTWYSDNKQYIERRVRAYDDTIKRVDFDFPLTDKDHVYPSLQYFIGKEAQIRDLSAYTTPTLQLLEKIRSYGNKPLLGLVPNPAPNMSSRDLAAYRPLLNYLADFEDGADFYVDLANVYDWQYSQPRNSQVTVDASALVSYPDGTKRLNLTGFPKANNYMNFHVEVNGIDVTNKDAVVQTGYALGVDRTLTGTALNDTATRGKQVWGNFYPTLVFLQNAPTSGDIVVKCSTNIWSGDSCHMNNYSKQLFAIDYATHIKE